MMRAQKEQAFGCGDQTWANIDTLIYDAARAKNATEEARSLRRILWALASSDTPLRVSRCGLHAYGHDSALKTAEDPATGEMLIWRSR